MMTLRDAIKRRPVLYRAGRRYLRTVNKVRLALAQRHMRRLRDYIRTVPDRVSAPMFVHVGANDGVSSDPCVGLLHTDPRWRGLLIEPVPDCFNRLRARFHDPRFILEQVAIDEREGTATFYHVAPTANADPAVPQCYDRIGSFDRRHILKHGSALEPYIIETKVAVRPLSALLTEHGIGDIHLLLIDAEGYDDAVLRTLDLSVHRPWAIFVEHKHLTPDRKRAMRDRLQAHGYRLLDCGRDDFAVRHPPLFS